MPTGAFLNDTDFRAEADQGRPTVEPFDPVLVQPASIDLRLSGEQYVYTKKAYRLGEEIGQEDTERRSFTELSVEPGQTVFVGLAEELRIPVEAVGFVFARSSVTRLGLIIAPVFMNPGYVGRLPLTVTNSAPFSITLVPKVRVAQLVCARLGSAPARAYTGDAAKYAGEHIQPSRLHDDEEIRAAIKGVLGNYFPTEFVQQIS